MNPATIPAALGRLPWSTQAADLPRFQSVRIEDDCTPGRADDTVYDVGGYDFGDELFSI